MTAPTPEEVAGLIEATKHWDWCPKCNGGLDTGLECTNCGADYMPYAAALESIAAQRDAAMKSLQELYDTPLARYMQQYKDEAAQHRATIERLEGELVEASTAHSRALAGMMIARDDRDRLRDALRELKALVQGECPSLLDEDSGGDAALALRIEAALAPGGTSNE